MSLGKPWAELQNLATEDLPAQLGVFELADTAGEVIYIGYGGGNTAFGLRTAIGSAVELSAGRAVSVRYELTHGYLSRWEELLMIHQHDFGRLPSVNDPADAPQGKLTPVGRGDSAGSS